MTTIVHFNYNVTGNVNIGDEAHVLAIQDALRQRIPDVEIIDLPISALCAYHVPPQLPGARLPFAPLHALARQARGLGAARLLRLINQADAVVIGGGGVYIQALLPFDTKLIRRITKPIIIIGAGYNHNFGQAAFDTEQTASIVALCQRTALQGVRDIGTQQFLDQLGQPSRLIGDPALFLEPDPDFSLPAISGSIRLAVNLAAHGWKQQHEYHEKLLAVYSDALTQLQASSAVELYYFVHYDTELATVEALRKRGVKFRQVIHEDARTTMKAYSYMDATISMMLHSTIMASGNSVPSLCIGYDDKNQAYMQLSGQIDRYIPVKQATTAIVLETLRTMIANHTQLSNDLTTWRESLRADQYDPFLDEATKIISRKGE